MIVSEREYVKFLLKLGVKYYPNHNCGCGCNSLIEIKECHYRNGIPKFLHGHYIIYKHPMIGKKHTEESKQKISLNRKGIKKTNSMIEKIKGKNNHWYGKKHTDEIRLIMSYKQLAESNSNWKGGISKDPYCPVFRNEEWRQMIYERDHHTCQNCGITRQLSYKIYDINLSIHHIDYNKENCLPNNCITLCNKCNTKANYHRWMWELIYKERLNVYN
jgi:hypothetical protein